MNLDRQNHQHIDTVFHAHFIRGPRIAAKAVVGSPHPLYTPRRLEILTVQIRGPCVSRNNTAENKDCFAGESNTKNKDPFAVLTS